MHRFNAKVGLKPVAILLMALLIASSAVALYEYNLFQGSGLKSSSSSYAFPNSAFYNESKTAFYNEFGAVPVITNVNSSFAPPISMYQALLIGLNVDSWNKTSLQGMTIHISFMPWLTVTDYNTYYKTLKLPMQINLSNMTSPPSSYSDVKGNGVIYQYVWQIDVGLAGVIQMPPPDLILIDASTGQILPTPILG